MKAAEFSAALGDVKDAYIQEALTYKPKKTIYFVRAAVAACLCIAILGGVLARYNKVEAVTFYETLAKYPRSGDIIGVRYETHIPVQDKTAVYEKAVFIDDEYETKVLPTYVGELYGQTELGTWYYPKRIDSLAYLILQDQDDNYSLWYYFDFLLPKGGTYTYGEVMEHIYGIKSAKDIVSITTKPVRDIGGELGQRIREEVGTHVYSESEDIEIFYEIAKDVVCYGADSRKDSDNVVRYSYSFSTEGNNYTGKYATGETTYGSRIISLQLKGGWSMFNSWQYSAIMGAFYDYTMKCDPLPEKDVYALNAMFGIK